MQTRALDEEGAPESFGPAHRAIQRPQLVVQAAFVQLHGQVQRLLRGRRRRVGIYSGGASNVAQVLAGCKARVLVRAEQLRPGSLQAAHCNQRSASEHDLAVRVFPRGTRSTATAMNAKCLY